MSARCPPAPSHRRRYARGLAVALVACGGCVLPLPTPEGRAGRLVGTDGRPVAGATVVIESLDIMQPPENAWPGKAIHRTETRILLAGQ